MPKVYPYRWVVLLVFMLITMVVEIQWLAHAAVARPAGVFYEGQFDPASFFNIDFLAMVYMLVFLVMSFPASYVIDTYGIRVGISIGAVLIGACGLLKGSFADDFVVVVIAQVGLAVAQPFILNAVTAVSVRCFPLREESTSQGMLLWVGQITGLIFVAGMSVQSNHYLPAFMTAFAVLSLISAVVVSFLRESPMIITEQDRTSRSV